MINPFLLRFGYYLVAGLDNCYVFVVVAADVDVDVDVVGGVLVKMEVMLVFLHPER